MLDIKAVLQRMGFYDSNGACRIHDGRTEYKLRGKGRVSAVIVGGAEVYVGRSVVGHNDRESYVTELRKG